MTSSSGVHSSGHGGVGLKYSEGRGGNFTWFPTFWGNVLIFGLLTKGRMRGHGTATTQTYKSPQTNYFCLVKWNIFLQHNFCFFPTDSLIFFYLNEISFPALQISCFNCLDEIQVFVQPYL